MVALVAELPEATSLVQEHLNDCSGDVLLHLLVADVGRLCRGTWQAGERDTPRRALNFLDYALLHGGEHVVNAIVVSFVENELDEAFIAEWPAGLQAELQRQRQAC